MMATARRGCGIDAKKDIADDPALLPAPALAHRVVSACTGVVGGVSGAGAVFTKRITGRD